MVREGLGYTLKDYNPCFNYNSDRFCCTKRGARFRDNILRSRAPLLHSNSYAAPRNYDPNDNRPLWLRQTGLVDPKSYTFTAQAEWDVWCNRMPCSVDQKGVPCQANQPNCHHTNVCGGK